MSVGAGAVGVVCAISAGTYIKPLFSAYDARKIVLSNSSIKFFQYDRIIEEIKIDELTDIRKTYSVLYHKSQHPNDIHKALLPIFFFLSLLIWHLPIVIFKFFFHLFKDGWKSYHFFDAIVVFSEEKFINILPVTKNEYEEIREYFMLKKPVFDIRNTKIYWYAFANDYENIRLAR
jgi:hypothetical protein